MGEAAWGEHDGVALLHLTALEALGGVQAVFTGRHGGVSARWGDGLNWSMSVGDLPENVEENRRRSLTALGLAPGDAVMAGLVHGSRVVAVPADEPPERVWGLGGTLPAGGPGNRTPGACGGPDADGAGRSNVPGAGQIRVVPDTDALITDRRRLALVVTAADCVPIYLYDPVRRVIGVAHAGWRGTVAGIAAATVRAMAVRFGCDPAQVHAAIGPSIGPCCYEVDEPVAGPVRQYYGDRAAALLRPAARPGRYMLDLWSANRLDLESAGVRYVSTAGVCTSCRCDLLFSHRAENGTAGRGAAIIALR